MTKFKATFLLLSAAFVFTAAGADASAQKVSKKAAPQPQQVAEADGAGDPERFKRDYIKSAEEYKASLQELAASYEAGLRKQAEKHEALKGLYTDGLIARREFEASEKSLAEASTKVEDVRREIATVEATLEAARKPMPVVPDAVLDALPRVEVAWTTGSAKIDGLIRLNGARYGVDPYLIYCIMHQESRFGAGAVSSAGAMGLMQLMPGTAARFGVTNPYDPAQSIMGGTRYLRELLRMFGGRVDLALAGYNAGEGAVMKYGRRIPPYRETQDYVRIISTRYAKGAGSAAVMPTAKTSERKPAPVVSK